LEVYVKKDMELNPSVHFLREKIEDLGSALFFNASENPVAFQREVIHAVNVDEQANIRFLVRRPHCLLPEDLRFPVRLEFYRKGRPFYIRISGIATVETDATSQEETSAISEDHDGEKNTTLVLSVKAECAEYQETSIAKSRSFTHMLWSLFY
jgi:hypothetical protein